MNLSHTLFRVDPMRCFTRIATALVLLAVAPACSRPPAATSDDRDAVQQASVAESHTGEQSEDAGTAVDPNEITATPIEDEVNTPSVEPSAATGARSRRADAHRLAEVTPIRTTPAATPTAEDFPPADPLEPVGAPGGNAPVAADPRPERTVETIETRIARLEPGTEFTIEFESALSSEWSQVGDEVQALVTESLLVDGTVAVVAGSVLRGEVVDARPTRRFGGTAALSISFHTLRLASGEEIEANLLWSGEDRGQKKKDAARIGGGAAAGAVAGSVVKDSDGAKVGALIGAAIGAARAARDRGQPVEIPEGSVRTLVLDGPLEVPVRIRRIEAR